MLRTPVTVILLSLAIIFPVFAEDNNNSDLLAAAKQGNTEIVIASLDKGADVNAKNESGETVLMVAAQEGHTAIVQVLLEKGADAKAKDKNGRTASMCAEKEGHSAAAELIKKAGEATE